MRPLYFLFLSCSLFLAACGGTDSRNELADSDESDMEFGPQNVESLAETAEGGAVVLLTASQEPYGEFLADGNGRALYMFTADEQGKTSKCTGPCLSAWPPLQADGDVQVSGPALEEAKLGTITRDDGTRQVTYAGWPLYYYTQDSGGAVNGQDVRSFGGEWYLVSPAGEMVHSEKHH